MRYKELYERFESTLYPNIDTIKLIKSKCSDIITVLHEFEEKLLYRSVSDKGSAFKGHTNFNDRFPRDQTIEFVSDELLTKVDYQKLVDEYLKKAGFKALRSNSIFVLSNKSEASEYGQVVYGIFPINGFHYTWHKEFADLIESEIFWPQMIEIKNPKWSNDFKKDTQKLLSSTYYELFKDDYVDLGLNYSFSKKVEERIKTMKFSDEIEVRFSLERFAKTVGKGFTNQNIYQAIEKGHEIYIHGDYYALSTEDDSIDDIFI